MPKQKFLVIPLILILMLSAGACGSTESNGVDPTALPYSSDTDLGGEISASADMAGRPEEGQVVYDQNCGECHALEEGVVIEGPSLYAAGESLEYDFVKESILDPHSTIAFIEDQFTDEETTMPVDFQEKLTPQQMEDVIAFVLSLKE